MGTRTTIVINDGQATPVAHTFKPTNVVDDVNSFADVSSGIAAGFPTITLSLREPVQMKSNGSSTNDRMYKCVAVVDLPILEVTSASTGTGIQPAPTRAYTLKARMEFLLPERSTLQNRKDLLAYAKNLLAHSVPTAMIQDLEDIWG